MNGGPNASYREECGVPSSALQECSGIDFNNVDDALAYGSIVMTHYLGCRDVLRTFNAGPVSQDA